MTSEPSQHAKLPVWQTAKNSYHYVWTERRLLAFPLAILVFLQMAQAFLPRPVEGSGTSGYAPIVAVSIIFAGFSIALLVGIHRTILLNEVRSGFAFFRWDRNFLRYLLASILVAGGGFVIFVVPLGLGGVILHVDPTEKISTAQIVALVVLWAGVIALVVRFLMIFPAAAIGAPNWMKRSWAMTRGSVFRLIGVILLGIIPIGLVNAVLNAITTVMAKPDYMTAGHSAIGLVALILSFIVSAYGIAVGTAAIALSYRALVKDEPIPTAEIA